MVPSGDTAIHQRSWDDAICKIEFDNLITSVDQIGSARLLAAASPHTGAWLQALPSPALGLHLDGDTIRIGVAANCRHSVMVGTTGT